MTWHIFPVAADGLRLTSPPLSTRDDTVHFAMDRDKDGLKMLGIEKDRGEVVDLVY